MRIKFKDMKKTNLIILLIILALTFFVGIDPPSLRDKNNTKNKGTEALVKPGTSDSFFNQQDVEDNQGNMPIKFIRYNQPLEDLEQYEIKGDGSDETSTLQQALDYARDNNIDTVSFPARKKIIISAPIIVHQNLNIIGNGCTIKLADNHPDMANFIKLKENTQTRQLKIDGNKHNGNTNSNGVRLYNNAVFENNEVFNVSSFSVFTYEGDHIKIADNIIRDSDQYGIIAIGDAGDYATGITISGNTISGCKVAGINLCWCANSVVTQNTIKILGNEGESSSGIGLFNSDGLNYYIDITNNNITGEGSAGFTSGIISDNVNNYYINIASNKINSVYRGITVFFTKANIIENEITDCKWTGIWLVSDDANIEKNTLTNAGIIVNTDENGYNPSKNLIRYNKISGGNQYWRALDTGIYFWCTTTDNVIEGNEIDVQDFCIKITDEYGQSTGTVVQNNKLCNKTGWIDDRGISTVILNNQQLSI